MIQLKVALVETESIVSTGFFGVEDSERDGTTVMESATMGGSIAGVAIRGEGIGAYGRVLVVVVEDRVMDLKIEGVIDSLEVVGRLDVLENDLKRIVLVISKKMIRRCKWI